MNIFYIDESTTTCARYHNDKHVVKMILEYAQLLSTAHRVLDGKQYIDDSTGRRMKRWRLEDPSMESILYKATHINHPSAIWARESKENYDWLHTLWHDLMSEYTYRYGKIHACDKLKSALARTPKNISRQVGFTQPTPAMPDEYKVIGDSLQSYRNYYIGAKQKMAKWKKRSIPEWFEVAV